MSTGGPSPVDDQGFPAKTTGGGYVAAFDFDGTITRRDTMLLFLTAARGRARVARVFARCGPQLVAAVGGGPARDRAKRLISRELLGGLTEEEAEAAARHTAREVQRSFIRSDTAARLRWHQREGHRVVVVSASFESYVRPAVAPLGVEEVLATRWEVDERGVLTGELVGQNVRGPAKVTQLAGLLGNGFRLEYAYGNSGGDEAMLARARHPVRVGRRPLPERGPEPGPTP